MTSYVVELISYKVIPILGIIFSLYWKITIPVQQTKCVNLQKLPISGNSLALISRETTYYFPAILAKPHPPDKISVQILC